ncbi:MAG: hypothetical protein IOMNBAOH_00511 [Rhodocyclaceae bacterium]|nr:hypothetical protein [Rhodocyclaceae bacterium]
MRRDDKACMDGNETLRRRTERGAVKPTIQTGFRGEGRRTTSERHFTAAMSACVVALFAVAGEALADKPDWAGGGHGRWQGSRHETFEDEHRRSGISAREARYFRPEHRHVVIDYYGREARAGHCPPGLRKKHNGCIPPGHARVWTIGYPLPTGVVYYPLTPPLLMLLPPPPPRHRYVQVAGDILMIAVGTGLVVDAIEDLRR